MTTLSQQLAAKFVERSTALGYKGKARDNAALDYFCGAATVYQLDNDKEKLDSLLFSIHMIAVRGYSYVLELNIKFHDNVTA